MDVTLVLPIREGKVLLGLKKRGFGKGWWNGFGGKPDSGESLEDAAIRELREESGLCCIRPDLEKVGIIDFYFPDKPEWDQTMHTYLLTEWKGEPKETEEMQPRWFSINALPCEQMWPADRILFPRMLAKDYTMADVYFRGKGEGIRHIRFKDPF